MKKEIKNKENEDARRKLRELKEKYELTWPEVAKLFEKALSSIEAWYQGKRSIPKTTRKLINIYHTNPSLFIKQKK